MASKYPWYLGESEAMEEDQQPLLQESPIPFVRNSHLRITKRHQLQGHDSARNSQSFTYGNHRPPNLLPRNGSQRNANFFTISSAGGHQLPQDFSRSNTNSKDSWSQLLPATLPPPQRKVTSPSNSLPSRSPTPGNDSRKDLKHWFRKGNSQSPSRKVTPSSEESSTYLEPSKVSQTSNNSGSSSRGFFGRLQRSLTPSPHRTASQPSSTTYRRSLHPSDTHSECSFRRCGSLPIPKTQPVSNSNLYLQPRVSKDTSPSKERLSRSTSEKVRPSNPWGEGSYMLWPLKPYTETDLQTNKSQHHGGNNSAHTTLNRGRKEDGQRRAVPRQAGVATISTVLPAEEQDPHSLEKEEEEEDRPGSRCSLSSRPRLQGIHSQPFGTNSDVNRALVQESRLYLPVNDGVPSSDLPQTLPRPLRKSTDLSSGSSSNSGSSNSSESSSSNCSSSDSNSFSRQRRYSGSPRDNLSSIYEIPESSRSISLYRKSSIASSDAEPYVLEYIDDRLDAAAEQSSKAVDPHRDHFSFLIENDTEYIGCLQDMLRIYGAMCGETPSHIRQHFDVFFKQMEVIYQFQIVLHAELRDTKGDLTKLAKVFKDEQFQAYSRYMTMTPNVQKDFQRHASYFSEHFPDLKRNILKPSLRINFYVMLLDSFRKQASEKEKSDLNSAIEFLNQLKRKANTLMTIANVTSSPVDLRLGGDVLKIGDLFCLSGGCLQKRKYYIILFENLLVITSSKMEFFKYKIHYRAERLEQVEAAGETEVLLQVLTEEQSHRVTMRFKAKNSSLRDQWVSELQKIVQQNTTLKQRECHTLATKEQSQLFPLDLYTVYPQLHNTMAQHDTLSTPGSFSTEEICQQLVSQEKTYVSQLSSLLNPDALSPAESLCILLGKLYTLHSRNILPSLDKPHSLREILNCFLENLELFDVYIDYLVIRCQMTTQLDQGTEARLYISPVQHLIFYLIWLRELCRNPTFREDAETILKHFQSCVRRAQMRLLTEAIINCRVDFIRSGDIIRHDKMEVRTKKKGRGGTYFALLFKKIIILTRQRPPLYEYLWEIWLDQVNMGPPTNSDLTFKLEVRQGGGKEPVTYEFRASSAATKQEWLKCIQQQMLQQAERIRKQISTDF
ncbi:uncharacterized protein LOC121873714 [Homarus americanus]|uniref:uncharacterized protein LOC121873714 n=1 Tax=Homarus americanus TaxID=6706 RepID=UPI001C469928|nr:uncharacterized protein LOC121873714 [Homarus americanus]